MPEIGYQFKIGDKLAKVVRKVKDGRVCVVVEGDRYLLNNERSFFKEPSNG